MRRRREGQIQLFVTSLEVKESRYKGQAQKPYGEGQMQELVFWNRHSEHINLCVLPMRLAKRSGLRIFSTEATMRSD